MMKKPREGLAEHVAKEIQQELKRSRWSVSLPGIRILCKEWRVSKNTMMIALNHLEKWGDLHPPEKGKPRKIVPKKEKKEKKEKRVFVILPRPREDLDVTARKVFEDLKERVTLSGGRYNWIFCPELLMAKGGTKVESVMKNHPSDVYLVVRAHHDVIESDYKIRETHYFYRRRSHARSLPEFSV